MDGRIKSYRKMLDRGWHTDPITLSVFMHILWLCNLETKIWKGIIINPGQLLTGIHSLSQKTGITEQSIRTALNHLKSTNELTIKSTNKYSIITVVKWGEYQLQDMKLTSKSTSKLTNNQQTTNKQLTTTKEDNNIITKENNIYMFENFWQAYPKKKGKDKSMLARNKIDPSNYDKAIEGAKLYASECKKLGTEQNYIKRPQGWLNDKRWLDTYEEDIEPSIGDKKHYDWYKQNIVGTDYTDIDGTVKQYLDINYRRFLIYDRSIDRPKATEIFEKVRGEHIDFSL